MWGREEEIAKHTAMHGKDKGGCLKVEHQYNSDPPEGIYSYTKRNWLVMRECGSPSRKVTEHNLLNVDPHPEVGSRVH